MASKYQSALNKLAEKRKARESGNTSQKTTNEDSAMSYNSSQYSSAWDKISEKRNSEKQEKTAQYQNDIAKQNTAAARLSVYDYPVLQSVTAPGLDYKKPSPIAQQNKQAVEEKKDKPEISYEERALNYAANNLRGDSLGKYLHQRFSSELGEDTDEVLGPVINIAKRYASERGEEYAWNDFQKAANFYNAETARKNADLKRLNTPTRTQEEIQAELDEAKKETGFFDNLWNEIKAFGTSFFTENPSETGAYNKTESKEILDGYKLKEEKVADLERELAERKAYDKRLEFDSKYASLANNEDFEENSEYKSTANGKYYFNPISETYTSGFDWNLYDAINGNTDAQKELRLDRSLGGDQFSLTGLYDYEEYQIRDDERAIFNYLYKTKGREEAQEFLNFIQDELYKRERVQNEKEAAEYANAHPVLSSLGTIAVSPLKGLAYVGQGLDMLDDGEINPNKSYNQLVYEPAKIRSTVKKDMGRFGSEVYDQVMSMGDSLMSIAVGGGSGLSTLLMASGGAAETTLDALDRGVSSGRAYLLGTISGTVSYLTEKASLDNLFEGWSKKGITKYILSQMATEGLEEGVEEIANTMADILISEDKSHWLQAVASYKKQGYSEGEAIGKALLDKGGDLLRATVGGAISGGMFSSVGAIGGRTFDSIKYIRNSDYRNMVDNVVSFVQITGTDINGKDVDAQTRIDKTLKVIEDDVKKYSDILNSVEESDTNKQIAGEALIDLLTIRDGIVNNRDMIVRQIIKQDKKNQAAAKKAKKDASAVTKTNSNIEAAPAAVSQVDTDKANAAVNVEALAETTQATIEQEPSVSGYEAEKSSTETAEPSVSSMVDSSNGTKSHNVYEELEIYDVTTPADAADAIVRRAGGVNAAVDEIHALRDQYLKDGSDESKAALNTLREIDAEIRNNGITRRRAYAANLKKALARYGITDVIIEDADSTGFFNKETLGNGWHDSSDGTIHLSPYLTTREAMYAVAAHELVHAASRGDVSFVSDLMNARNKLIEAGLYSGASIDKYREAYKNEIEGMSEADAGRYIEEEMIGDFIRDLEKDNGKIIDYLATNHRSLLQRIIDFFANLFDKNGQPNRAARQLAEDLRKAYNRSDLATTGGAKVDAKVREASAVDGKTVRSSMDIASDIQKKYEADVDAVLNGTYNSSDPLIIGRTPEGLERIGLATLPVTITSNHVYSIAKTEAEAKADNQYNKGVNYHGLGADVVKNIMSEISNPIMVVISPDSAKSNNKQRNSAHRIIVIVELSLDNKKVIAPIEIDAEVSINQTQIDSNHVVSYYDKNNVKSLVEETFAQENIGKTAIYYGNKKRIEDFVKPLGLQLPARFKNITDSDTIIRNVNNNVNRKIENVTQSQQFKRWFGDWQNDPKSASKVVNADGTPKILYHQTAEDFTEFDARHEGAGTNDDETPFGIFMKPSDSDIGLNGKKQMALYARIVNPLVATDRAELVNQIKAMSSKYADLVRQRDALSVDYQKKIEDAAKAWSRYAKDYRASHPDATRSEIYDDPEFRKLFEAEDVLSMEWVEKANELSLQMKEEITQTLKNNKYDGVILKSDAGSGGRIVETYIALESSQVKSATDNIGTFDADNPDIRYSRDIETDAEKTIRRQQERIEYLSKQLRSHTPFGWAKSVSPTARRNFAAGIASELPGISVDTVSSALKEVWNIFEAAKKDGSDTAESRVGAAMEKAFEVASELVSNAVQTEINPLYEQYNDLRNRLRTTPVKMSVSKTEFGGDADYRAWRSENKGLLRVSDSESALPIDTYYQELSARYPEFFPEDITNTADQLKRLGDAAVELKNIASSKTEKVNPLEDVADSFTVDLANRILYGFDQIAKINPGAKYEYGALKNEQDVREAYATGNSDAAYREAEAYERGEMAGKKQNEKEVQAALEREEIQRQIFERDFKQAQKNFVDGLKCQNDRIYTLERRIEQRSEKNRLTVARRSVLSTLNRLNTMLMNPNRSKHIPQSLRAPVARLIASLGTTKLPNGKTVRASDMLAINDAEYGRFEAESIRVADDLKTIINSNKASANNAITDQFIDRLTNNIETLKQIYAEINPHSADDAVYTPNLADTRKIDYIKQVGKILNMVEHYVKDSNVIFLNHKAVSAREASERLIDDLKNRRAMVSDTGKASVLREFFAGVGYEFLSADMAFQLIGESGVDMMQEYRRGQTMQAKHEQEYVDYMLGVTDGKYKTHSAGYTGKLYPVTSNPNGPKATKSQIMQLYLTWKRPAGRRHLKNGGAIFTNELGQESKSNTVQITQKIYDDLVSNLTSEDKRVADAVGKFLSRRCAEWGNEASMRMYGYRMYEDRNYFPLDVSQNALPTKWDSLEDFYKLENAGMTKALKSDASAPLRMTDIFDVADYHVRTMAAYSAFAPVSNDVQKIMNMPGVSEAMNYGLGKKGVQYFEKLMKTIASNKVRSGELSDAAAPLQFLMNAYKRQAVAYNISTALKQPLSIVRALNEIEGKYVAEVPLVMSKAEYSRIYDTMLEYSGVAKMKILGFSDTGFGKSMRALYDKDYVNNAGIIRGALDKNKVGRGAVKAYDKFTDMGMWAAGKMDEITWVRIWKACELEVIDKHSGLSAKDALEKTADRFNQIIGRTQVVDTILDTAPIMRNKAMAILTPFMNEPVKAMASIITAADAVKNGKPNAGKKLRKAVGLVLLNNLVLEPIISTLMTMWKDEEDDTESIIDFCKKFLKVYAGVDVDEGFSFTEFMSSNVVGGLFSFPIIQIFYETFVDSSQNYSNEKIDTAAISNLIKTTRNLISNISKSKEERVKSNYKLTVDFLGAVGAVFGIPANTLRRQTAAMYRSVLNVTDSYELQWEYNKTLYNLENASARTQKGFYDILAAVYKAGDTEAYKKMLDDLTNVISDTPSAISIESIKKAIEDRGGEIEVGSDLWNITTQARFYLPTFNSNMKVENFLSTAYRELEKSGINGENILLDMPSAKYYSTKIQSGSDKGKASAKPKKYDYIIEVKSVDGESVECYEMSAAGYEQYIGDVGLLSYQVLREVCSSANLKKWTNLTAEQKEWAVQKIYDYAKRKYTKEFNTEYNIGSGGSWMEDLYKKNAGQVEIAEKILKEAKKKKFDD